MISLDQICLLEEKVESAVEKIQQLQAENDALRKKCSELTNALSSKTEQLNTFSVDQNQIEEGIKKALDRLNSIENSVLKAADQGLNLKNTETSEVAKPEVSAVSKPVQTAEEEQKIINISEKSAPASVDSSFTESFTQEQPVLENNTVEEELEPEIQEEPVTDFSEPQNIPEPSFNSAPTFNSMSPVKSQTEVDLENTLASNSKPANETFAENPSIDIDGDIQDDDLGFDIF